MLCADLGNDGAADNKVASLVNIDTTVEHALSRTDGELVAAQSRTIQVVQVLELTAADQRVCGGVHGRIEFTVKGTAVELIQRTIGADVTIEHAAMELELRTVGSVTTAVRHNVASIKHTIVEADDGAVLNTALAGSLDNSLAGSSNAAGFGSVSLDVQSVTCRGSAVVYDLDRILVLGCGHGVGTQVQDVVLSRAELDHLGQGHVRQQGQSGAVGPVCDCLVDGGILSIANLRDVTLGNDSNLFNGLLVFNRLLVFNGLLVFNKLLVFNRLLVFNGLLLRRLLARGLFGLSFRLARRLRGNLNTTAIASTVDNNSVLTCSSVFELCCEDIRRYHTDDHNERQHKAQNSFEISHFDFHSFLVVYFPGCIVLYRGGKQRAVHPSNLTVRSGKVSSLPMRVRYPSWNL